MNYLSVYIVASLLFILLDVGISYKASEKGTVVGSSLCLCGFCAAAVSSLYLASVLSHNYLFVSVMSSLYFIAIDLMLNALLHFAATFVRLPEGKIRIPFFIFHIYAVIDIIIFLINPFHEIAIHYVDRGTQVARYGYQMLFLYELHLVYSYLLIVLALGMLLYKGFHVATGYRAQYFLSVLGILFVIVLNSIFLYLPNMGLLSRIDFSVNTYGLIILFLYWTSSVYPQTGMLNILRQAVVQNIDQGLLLFDYNGELILSNDRARVYLADTVALTTGLPLHYFLDGCGIEQIANTSADNYSIQCYVRHNGDVLPLRIDYRHLKNQKNQTIGQLFTISDVALETDLLTGFHNWQNFCHFAEDNVERFPVPTTVVACDINGLSTINSSLGKESGDQAIKTLADCLRKYFQKDAYYVRGDEATLLVIDYFGNNAETIENIKAAQSCCDFTFQYAIASTSSEHPLLMDAIADAIADMKNRKILNHDAVHSSVLNLLERALLECDPDTEQHVLRTRTNGARFAEHIDLSSKELSQLELLCVMHDIGKIGVPLDILTKPSRLTDEEWAIMKSHVTKGYQIAMSSPDLQPIANMILHHHERWDGAGYPDGLSKESIPLLSRIIAIVDAYDAMISQRPYKEPMTPAEAQNELIRCAGTQFDPRLVSEFIQMLRENCPEIEVRPSAAPPKAVKIKPAPNPREDYTVYPVSYAHYYLTPDMEIFNIDHHFTELTGYTESDLAEKKLKQYDLLPENERADYTYLVEEQIARNQNAYLEHHIMRKDGTIVDVLCFGRQYYDVATRSMRSEMFTCRSSGIKAVQNYANIEKTRAKNQLKHWEDTYRRDSLTGLLSHGAFVDDLEVHLLRSTERVVLLMFDVDHFKSYNDTFGHRAGDEFLIYVAQTISNCTRSGDLTCRMGGDEFAAALFIKTTESNKLIAERIQQIFDQLSVNVHAAYDKASISLGVSISRAERETFDQLYDRADKALYHSKENGRARYTISE